jgi:uncharacterized membrane protein
MKTFLNGLGLVIPTALILYILVWVLTQTELFFKKILLTFIPLEYYITGMGFIFGLIAVYIIGLLLKFWIVQTIRDFLEKLIDKTPIFSSLYGGIKDFLSFLSNMKKNDKNSIVLVEFPSVDAKMIGFITADDLENFHKLEMEDPVMVYLQMSYQIGGYALFIPRKNLTPLDMKIEDALRFVTTAGISKNNEDKNA